MRVESIEDVVKWRLCVGCGACAYHSRGAVGMINDLRQGHRPVSNGKRDEAVLRECLKVCPAVGTRMDVSNRTGENLQGMAEGVGPVLEVWEGHAIDPETRFLGSSGGALTALALYAIERAQMHGVLHVAGDTETPLRNRTVMSRSRGELLANTGSRYAPASACDSLKQIEDAPAACVFIGQPSEVAALRKAQELNPGLDRKVGVALSFFCAGSPSTQGTIDLLESRGIEPSRVERIRYRGRGWPGMFAVWLKGEAEPALEMTYAESWAYVQAYRPWGVQLWPDAAGEHADISCCDPWYRAVMPGEQGSSLLVVRTEAGKQLVRGAIESGYLELSRVELKKVIDSQKGLLLKKGAVWGRVMSMRLLGLPVPQHLGYHLFHFWLQLTFLDKIRSTAGTLRRILSRKYYRPDTQAMPIDQSVSNG